MYLHTCRWLLTSLRFVDSNLYYWYSLNYLDYPEPVYPSCRSCWNDVEYMHDYGEFTRIRFIVYLFVNSWLHSNRRIAHDYMHDWFIIDWTDYFA